MEGLNAVDYAILGIFLFSMLVGLSRGFVKEVISLVTWLAAFLIASLFATRLASVFTGSQPVHSVISSANSAAGIDATQPVSWLALGASFTILFIVTLIIGAIINSIITRAIEGPGISFINRLLGALFGCVRGFLINLGMIFLIQLAPVIHEQPWWTGSKMVNAFQPSVQWLTNLVAPSLESLKTRMGNALQGVGSTIQDTVNSYKGGN